MAAIEQELRHPPRRARHQPLSQVQDGHDCHGGCRGRTVRTDDTPAVPLNILTIFLIQHNELLIYFFPFCMNCVVPETQ